MSFGSHFAVDGLSRSRVDHDLGRGGEALLASNWTLLRLNRSIASRSNLA